MVLGLLCLEPVSQAQQILKDFDGDVSTDLASMDGLYIIPNEHDNYLYGKYLTSTQGVYIAVGSFRGLNTAMTADFSNVVLFDRDPEVVKFNRIHLKIIDQSKTQEDYLRKICKDPLQETFRKLSFSAKIAIKYICGEGQRKVFLDENYFFFDEDRFQKIKKLISEGRISVVQGDLTGTKSLKYLAQQMKEKNLTLSAIDISNSHYDIKKPGEVSRMLENLLALPHDEKSQILFTSKGSEFIFQNYAKKVLKQDDAKLDPGTDWHYFGVNLKQFIAKTKQSHSVGPRLLLQTFFSPKDISWKQEPQNNFVMIKQDCAAQFIPTPKEPSWWERVLRRGK